MVEPIWIQSARDSVANWTSQVTGLTAKQIDEFDFIDGVTPLASIWTPFIVVPLYLLSIVLCKAIVNYRTKPFQLNSVVIVHNSLLSISSALLFVALVIEICWMTMVSSMMEVFCNESGRWIKGRVSCYYYINYIFKYIELLDTILLCLRGKPTPFLHVYHHAATLVLCFTQLRSDSCVQWLPIVVNLFIHIIMYLYYTLHALGVNVWWKKYLTLGQIIQFVIALVGCYVAWGIRLLGLLGFSWAPVCYGTEVASMIGCGVISSYLFLFIRLYRQSYKHKTQE